jgi:glutamyl-tRNA synthetase
MLQGCPIDYRGRLAPSPTGHLHLGHARTFWIAQQRARQHRGTLILRNEDLDRDRCKPEFVEAMVEDLRWFGFEWDEGPDLGGPHASYRQSERLSLYRNCFNTLRDRGLIYPCTCSRRDIRSALSAPHAGDEEPLYPGTCRPLRRLGVRESEIGNPKSPQSWRFQVPDGEPVRFTDRNCGPQEFVAGRDFGDFVVWRHDGVPSYQLAVVVDDQAMRITEVVRGMDLLLSTARQLLLYRALEWPAPGFFHCPLLTDDRGVRLAKRHQALSLRTLRVQGATPAQIRQTWELPGCL